MIAHRGRTDDKLVIPSCVLHGSRAMQLMQFEGQLAKLHAIRRTLVVDDGVHVGHTRGRDRDGPAGSWFVAGAVIALALLMLSVGAWIASGEATVAAAPKAALLAATR